MGCVRYRADKPCPFALFIGVGCSIGWDAALDSDLDALGEDEEVPAPVSSLSVAKDSVAVGVLLRQVVTPSAPVGRPNAPTLFSFKA